MLRLTKIYLVCITFFMITMSPLAFGKQKIKQPNVSGQFYSADPKRLGKEIEGFFANADVKPYPQLIEIVIAPHAGYVYSGAVAAYGFKAASQHAYKTIVILAPSHFYQFDGISIWDKGGFQTPLGIVNVDEEFASLLTAADDQFVFDAKAFEREHSLEVEIPFLQKTFENYKIVPVIMGYPQFATLEKFAATLKEIIGERNDVLIVVSTDLSHYHDDATAREMDQRTIDAIEGLKIKQLWQESHQRTMEMCGFIPVTTALLYAKHKGLDQVDVLRYANSADVSGDKQRVVGYTSILIYNGENLTEQEKITPSKQRDQFSLDQRKKLLSVARSTIEEYLHTGKILKIDKPQDKQLMESLGVFVTIEKDHQLRGCIGKIIGQGPLIFTVRDMAIASATRDARFSPVTKDELKDIEIEVSVLSKLKVVKNIDEIELGTHGVIISQGLQHHGVYLPQVAESTGWSKEEFLSQLCTTKAGLTPDAWKDPKTKIEIFTAEVFSERDVP